MPLAGWMLVQARGLSAWQAVWLGGLVRRDRLHDRLGAQLLAGRMGRPAADQALRPLDHGQRGRPGERGQVVCPLGRLGGVYLPPVAHRAHLHLFPGRRYQDQVLALPGLHLPRLIHLVRRCWRWAATTSGANWEELRRIMRPFDIPIAMVIVQLSWPTTSTTTCSAGSGGRRTADSEGTSQQTDRVAHTVRTSAIRPIAAITRSPSAPRPPDPLNGSHRTVRPAAPSGRRLLHLAEAGLGQRRKQVGLEQRPVRGGMHLDLPVACVLRGTGRCGTRCVRRVRRSRRSATPAPPARPARRPAPRTSAAALCQRRS